jgi:ABC-type polysaccharide/polyol phosphate transport system ATPase subunit
LETNIAIKVENLSKLYTLRESSVGIDRQSTNELWALKDVSFEIKKGESVGIIGPNGSGKSTLLKILAGITKPTFGKVTIKGRVASILDIGAGFHPELSGRENIFLNGQLLGFTKKEIQSHYNEIVEFSGIEKFIDEPVKNYSNGMYLRLAFSVMAHLDFDVYLLDEVLSVGDANFILKTTKKIIQLSQKKKTIVYISHNMQDLENKDLYLWLEYGVLKEKTRFKKVLDEYIRKAINSIDNMHVHTENVEITDFSSFQASDEVKVHSMKFYQEKIEEIGFFCTNKSFILEVQYEKTDKVNTLDLVIYITDFMGTSVLSTAPFIKGEFSDNKKSGKHTFKCVFPEYLFNAQVYFLSIYFPMNLAHFVEENKNSVFSDDYFGGGIVEMAFGLKNIVAFKGVFIKNNEIMDLSEINLRGNLLAGFEWK